MILMAHGGTLVSEHTQHVDRYKKSIHSTYIYLYTIKAIDIISAQLAEWTGNGFCSKMHFCLNCEEFFCARLHVCA